MKELSNSIMNQANYWNDCAKNKVVDFNKELIRQNPMNSMQYNWYMAQMRKTFVFYCTLPFVIGQTYWDTWISVFDPEGRK